MYIGDNGFLFKDISMLKSMSFNFFHSSFLTGWQLKCQPLRNHIRKSLDPHFNKVLSGVYWVHLVRPSAPQSACPSEDGIGYISFLHNLPKNCRRCAMPCVEFSQSKFRIRIFGELFYFDLFGPRYVLCLSPVMTMTDDHTHDIDIGLCVFCFKHGYHILLCCHPDLVFNKCEFKHGIVMIIQPLKLWI